MAPLIGILTALPEYELPAVLRAFEIPIDRRPDEIHRGERYWLSTFRTEAGRTYRLAISCIGASGNTESQVPTDRLIQLFSPELMILVGIGCGAGFSLGDVATSGAVWAYEYLKTQEGKNLNRSRAKVTPSHLQSDVAFFNQTNAWHRQLSAQVATIDRQLLPRSIPEAPRFHGSQWIASGEKVMGAGELATLNQFHDSIRIGEMEGYGFANACDDQRPPIPWLIVRGISDFGDKSKDGTPLDGFPAKDEYHCFAAESAAAFCKVFLGSTYTEAMGAETSRTTSQSSSIVREGVSDVFASDFDPAFTSQLVAKLNGARRSIVFAGMGLSFLKGNTALVLTLTTALHRVRELTVEIFYGDPSNPGIRNRIREEASDGALRGRAYSRDWPKTHIASIRRALESRLTSEEQGRLKIRAASCLPMATIVRADDAYFWYAYGTPNIRGKESPWIMLDAPGEDSELRKFLDTCIAYYQETSSDLSSGRADGTVA
ncbi:MAG: hypothetical protein HY854_05910 [Burkholderiales bacterium]|nr:hypothetical protein [Burkholderiales bacterium]